MAVMFAEEKPFLLSLPIEPFSLLESGASKMRGGQT